MTIMTMTSQVLRFYRSILKAAAQSWPADQHWIRSTARSEMEANRGLESEVRLLLMMMVMFCFVLFRFVSYRFVSIERQTDRQTNRRGSGDRTYIYIYPYPYPYLCVDPRRSPPDPSSIQPSALGSPPNACDATCLFSFDRLASQAAAAALDSASRRLRLALHYNNPHPRPEYAAIHATAQTLRNKQKQARPVREKQGKGKEEGAGIE